MSPSRIFSQPCSISSGVEHGNDDDFKALVEATLSLAMYQVVKALDNNKTKLECAVLQNYDELASNLFW